MTASITPSGNLHPWRCEGEGHTYVVLLHVNNHYDEMCVGSVLQTIRKNSHLNYQRVEQEIKCWDADVTVLLFKNYSHLLNPGQQDKQQQQQPSTQQKAKTSTELQQSQNEKQSQQAQQNKHINNNTSPSSGAPKAQTQPNKFTGSVSKTNTGYKGWVKKQVGKDAQIAEQKSTTPIAAKGGSTKPVGKIIHLRILHKRVK